MSTRIIQFATGYQSAADVTGVLNADTIVFAPYLTIGAVNVQDAIEELKDELDAEVLVLEGADATLQSNINGVQSNLDAAEIALQAQITTNTSNISANTSAISGLGTSKQDASNAVTTDTNQTITGVKTFDTELIVKELATKPTAPSSTYKKIYAKDDGKVYTLNSDDEEVEVGSGAGGGSKNYVDNGSFDTNLVGWSTDDTDNFTIAAETVAPLAGTASLKITRVGAGTNVVTGTIAAIDEADVGTLIAAEAVVKLTGTGTYTIEMHDGTIAVPGTVTTLQAGKHRYTFDFIPATGVTYTIKIRDTAGVDADVLLVDEVRVGPNPAIIGGAGGWKEYDRSAAGLITGTGWTTSSAFLVPYKDPVSGNWRLRFNIQGTTSSAVNTIAFTLVGVVFRTGVSFPFSVRALQTSVADRSAVYSRVSDAANGVLEARVSDNANSWTFSGDLPLQSKPTWADFDGTVAMLTPSVLGENARVRYYRNAAYSYTANATFAWDAVDTTTFKTNGTFTNSSGNITIPVDGTYEVNVAIQTGVLIDANTLLQIYVTRGGGSPVQERIVARIGSASFKIEGSSYIYLLAGDKVQIRLNGDATTVSADVASTYLEIIRIADRSSRGALGFGLATSTAAGLVSANKTQTKLLGSNVTGSGNITAWTFNNLVIGKVYRLDLSAYYVHTSSSDNQKSGQVTTTHNAVNYLGPTFAVVYTTGDQVLHSSLTFTAAATTVTHSVSLGNMQLWNSHSRATLTELNNTVSTTDFT